MSIAIVTPSFAPDLPLCRILHESVLRHTPDRVIHYLVVPDEDVAAFTPLSGPRCVVWPESALLPRRILRIARIDDLARRAGWSGPRISAVNLRRPYPPIRGWILQQLLKLATAREVDEEVILLVDSDVVFLRDLDESALVRDGAVRFFRRPGAVDASLPRHVAWHAAARELLGLPAAAPPLPDYVSSLNIWDARLVGAMLERIEAVTARPWIDAIGARLHFSEWTLYGVFGDALAPPAARGFVSNTTLCHSYWDPTPLDLESATAFLHACPDEDVAVLIQSKSGTPLGVREAALARAGRPAGAGPVDQLEPSTSR